MPKFFVSQTQLKKDEIDITGTDFNHIKNVLRLKIGNEIEICLKEINITYVCVISKFSEKEVVCKIKEKLLYTTEPKTYIHLFQGLPKADKMEYIIEKGTEIGISEITPVYMNRCISRLDEKKEKSKNERWNKIAEVASKQSGRDYIPIINKLININNIFEKLKDYDIVILAYEKEKKVNLKSILKSYKTVKKIAIIVGPEGGLEECEVNNLKEIGAKVITLGNRILRTETASLVIASNIIYELED